MPRRYHRIWRMPVGLVSLRRLFVARWRTVAAARDTATHVPDILDQPSIGRRESRGLPRRQPGAAPDGDSTAVGRASTAASGAGETDRHRDLRGASISGGACELHLSRVARCSRRCFVSQRSLAGRGEGVGGRWRGSAPRCSRRKNASHSPFFCLLLSLPLTWKSKELKPIAAMLALSLAAGLRVMLAVETTPGSGAGGARRSIVAIVFSDARRRDPALPPDVDRALGIHGGSRHLRLRRAGSAC